MYKVILILGICAIGTIIPSQVKNSPSVMNDVMLENVEALSDTDDTDKTEEDVPLTCWSSGDYTCPGNGAKVGFIYEGNNLVPDEETY